MSAVVIYLVAGSIILLANSLTSPTSPRGTTSSLAVLTLSLAMTMDINILIQIVIMSAILVNLITLLDVDTAMLFQIGTIGLVVLCEAKDLLTIYMAIELVSLTFYILAARERTGVKSTEAGLKYFVLGALTSGFLLMGIAIVYAQTGSTNIGALGV